MTSADKFNARMSEWLAGLTEPWNRLRYTICRANLHRHLPNGALQILDAGGGSGSEAIPLALEGHAVTLVDYSDEMLAEARRAARNSGITERLIFHQASLLDLPALFPKPAFDGVLCHNVIQYVDDMPGAIKAICAPLKPGGIVSIVSMNRYSELLQAALMRHDLDEALSKIDVRASYVAVFDTTVHRYAGEELIEPLQAAGCALLGHYGVRCVNDYIADNDRKFDPDFYARLERLELALSDRYPYYLTARMFQLIARKG